VHWHSDASMPHVIHRDQCSPRRARLACVNRALRRFYAAHATRTRQSTKLVVPFERWEAYVRGAGRWLAWHAVTLQAVRLSFEVRVCCPASA